MVNYDLYTPLNTNKICAFRRGFADGRANRPTLGFQSVEYPVSLRLNTPYHNEIVYAKALKWCEDTKLGIENKHSGLTIYNGNYYYSYFDFKTEEDKLAFCLTFPELV